MSVFNGPITSGVLATVDKVNTSASYFAPAGAGPGPTPALGSTIICSTLVTNGGGSPDIAPVGEFTLGSSTMGTVVISGDLAGGISFQVGAQTTTDTDMSLYISSANIYTPFKGSSSYLQLASDRGAGGVYGNLFMGAQPDGTAYIASVHLGTEDPAAPSTLSVVADNVNMSSLTVSSINGGAYPPKAEIPTDIAVSSIAVGDANGLSIRGFTQPLISYGATLLNGSGQATVVLDYTYTDPYYPNLTYRGTLGANTSTLSVSTLTGDSFQVWGEANTQVIYTVFGN